MDDWNLAPVWLVVLGWVAASFGALLGFVFRAVVDLIKTVAKF